MPSTRSLTDPAGRWLARHLSRLCATLDGLAARLRRAVSTALGEAAFRLVREAVNAALADPPPPPAQGRIDSPCGPERTLWGGPGDPDEGPWPEGLDDSPTEAPDDSPAGRIAAAAVPGPRAVAAGVGTAVRWLRRRAPLPAAVAAGVLAGLAGAAGGPLAAAALALADAALRLLSLAGAVRSGAAALAAFGP
jgi:hypothetical protein